MTGAGSEEVTSFSLLLEPWLQVRRSNGDTQEVSLLDAFAEATDIAGLAGELPTQEVACLRLMLAVLYRCVEPGEANADQWSEWFDDPAPLFERAAGHLRQHAARFDLLHLETPFFQVAGLRTAKNEASGVGKLIAEVPDGYQFFTTRAGAATTSLTYAEAARWLVHAQAFDYSGIKSGAVGDDRVKGGRGYPIGTGFTGSLGLLIAEGANLAETLMLNLVLDMWAADDRTPWEMPADSAAVNPQRLVPRGPADVATWQIRRIRLEHNGVHVTGVVLANGDPIGPQNRLNVEPQSSWRYSEPQTKKFGHTVYMPLEHYPERGMWRGLAATLGHGSTAGATKSGEAAYRRAGLLNWLGFLEEHEDTQRAQRVTLRAVGIGYGPQSSSVAAIVDDRLVLPLKVLADDVVEQRAVDAVTQAEAVGRAVGRFAANIADAGGRRLLPGAKDGVRDGAAETFYAAVAPRYAEWLRGLGDRDQLRAQEREWQQSMKRLAQEHVAEIASGASPAALVGREIGGHRLNLAIAESYLYVALRKALPLAFETTPSEGRKEAS